MASKMGMFMEIGKSPPDNYTNIHDICKTAEHNMMERTLKRRSIGDADCHPLSVRRFAPSIKRMQRTVASANKFASVPADDPQPRYVVNEEEKRMAYRNKVYVSMDADCDIRYYYLMKAWKQNDSTSFSFYDAHDLNTILDKSEKSIKAGLQARFRESKAFVLLVGEQTRYLYKYVRWEIEQAIKRELPCVVVNINGLRFADEERCPPIIRNDISIHISFNSKILQYALENWPSFHYDQLNKRNRQPYHYKESVYQGLGL